jgi:hypothetical protein
MHHPEHRRLDNPQPLSADYHHTSHLRAKGAQTVKEVTTLFPTLHPMLHLLHDPRRGLANRRRIIIIIIMIIIAPNTQKNPP